MIKELTKKQFEEKFPNASTYAAEYDPMPVFLEDGAILLSSEWNGEEYHEAIFQRVYRPVYSGDEIIGYEDFPG